MKKVVLLFDLNSPPPESHDYSDYLRDDAWESEKKVSKALEKLGYDVQFVGVFDDLPRLILDLQQHKPDFVFNMCEAFNGRRDLTPQVAGVLELLQIPYTGTQSFGIGLCQDKGLSKKILQHHRIRVPHWVSSRHQSPLRSLKKFAFPAFVKLAREEASEGISRDSFVENEKDCLDRVKFLHERYQADVLIEEFIAGREFYVSMLGGKRVQVFPTRELTFREFPDDVPRFATFKAKWDEEYRKRWGIRTEFARLSPELKDKIDDIAKRSYAALSLHGYARLDIRLTEKEEVVVLEANPNPSLSSWDDFALSAEKAGIEFVQLIEKIVAQRP